MPESKTWIHQSPHGSSVLIAFDGETVTIRKDNEETNLAPESVFDSYGPFGDFPLEQQNEMLTQFSSFLFRENRVKADSSPRILFWQAFPKLKIPKAIFKYKTKISKTYRWVLTIDGTGIIYEDADQMYGQQHNRYSQTLSDFWFYGPLYPIPDITLRSTLVDIVKSALIDTGFNFPLSHFEIFKYPVFINAPVWSDGDSLASSFVIVRDYGIEWGRENFHDGLVFLGFLSFEHCMNRPDHDHWILTKEILASIREDIRPAD